MPPIAILDIIRLTSPNMDRLLCLTMYAIRVGSKNFQVMHGKHAIGIK